jgi:hypothetical protein
VPTDEGEPVGDGGAVEEPQGPPGTDAPTEPEDAPPPAEEGEVGGLIDLIG